MTKKKLADKIILTAAVRKVFGKKLRKLRYEGVIPANIYGTGFKSTAITLPYKDFLRTYRQAKNTSVVYIILDKEEIPVLINNVQRHPVTDIPLHIDLRKIDLAQKVITEVPVAVIGQSEAVTQKAGVLLTQTPKLSVEALPQHIPQTIEIDISVIKEIGQEIKVADIAKSSSFTIKDEPTKVIVSVIAHKEESVTPETTAATPEVITEKVPAEGEEAEAPAEAGKKPAEAAGKPEAKPAAGKPAAGKPAPAKPEAKKLDKK